MAVESVDTDLVLDAAEDGEVTVKEGMGRSGGKKLLSKLRWDETLLRNKTRARCKDEWVGWMRRTGGREVRLV